MKACNTCRSEYDIKEIKMIHRDEDDISCEVCGEKLMSWNGAVSYNAKLIKRGSRKAKVTALTTAYRIENGDAINTNLLVEPGPCEVISPILNFNMLASELVPVPGQKLFCQVRDPNNLFILANFISFD